MDPSSIKISGPLAPHVRGVLGSSFIARVHPTVGGKPFASHGAPLADGLHSVEYRRGR